MKFRATFLIALAVFLAAAFVTVSAHHWATTVVCDAGVQSDGQGIVIMRKDPSPIPGFKAYERVWYQDLDGNGRYSGDFEVVRVRTFIKLATESLSCPTAPTRAESSGGKWIRK